MAKKLDYGMDVEWKAGETRAFMIYNKMCGEQAMQAFRAAAAGKPFVGRPAADIAAEARAIAASQGAA